MPRTALTEEQVRHYREEGWLIIRGFVNHDGGELAHWRRTTIEAVDARGPIAVGGAMHHSIPYKFSTTMVERQALRTLPGGDTRLTQRTNLWMTHSGMRELMLNAQLGEMLSELAGVDGMRIWHDSAL